METGVENNNMKIDCVVQFVASSRYILVLKTEW